MAEITAALVKQLRERSGAGMMDCKKALGETGGDMESAVDWLMLSKRVQVRRTCSVSGSTTPQAFSNFLALLPFRSGASGAVTWALRTLRSS